MTEFITEHLIKEGYDGFSVSQNGNIFTSSLGIDLTTYIEKGLLDEVRKIRNVKLAETDWWSGSDLIMSASQIAYRQALRDLPSTASPEIDSAGAIIGITYPTKP